MDQRMNLFKDLLPSIYITQEDVLENEKDYVSFVVNRALSFHPDTILYAQEMNARPFMDARMQYDYLRKSVRKYRRPFKKWEKKEKVDSNLEGIMRELQYSPAKAQEVINILGTITPKDITCHMNLPT